MAPQKGATAVACGRKHTDRLAGRVEPFTRLAAERKERSFPGVGARADVSLSLGWTENRRRRAYAILASPRSDDDDPVDEWERECAAETVRYFETEHDEVVADAERRYAADPRSARPYGGGEAYDRAMARSALASFASLADQAKWGAEAVEAFLPIAKEARGGKDDDPNLDIHIDMLASTFCWRFIKAKKDHTTMEALDNVVPLRRPESKKPCEPPGLLKLTWVHQTEDDDQRQWLLYGMFAKGEMSVIFGEPSAGKSIIAGDIALHVAHGMPWFGMETTRSPVLYYAAERAKLVKRVSAG
jgi:AAA domain